MTDTTTHTPLRLEPMVAGDLAAVLAVQAACYPAAMQETADAALVSVQDSRRFWESAGFTCAHGDVAALATYPAGAAYMTRHL
jgi:hypothetical protein